ncbi:MAG: bifunctional [glutamate--ammonia ligase]-adenylyl-L-tyrosine phosphorylase/[glutamate--ammonia-ligase] adenylyltransferase [Verrucomicrobia bacterium]|nr:bifunctional [glutamate--ammonia ligase]-adenylyl-L-tyrosine phosphorylase/[glutamate--ammonia-ligase] adenylyltransferase [Verrucomicrobiota bacterium]
MGASPKPAPPSPVWKTALAAAPDPARARHYLEQFAATPEAAAVAGATPEQARLLCALWSGSTAWSDLLLAHPEELHAVFQVEELPHPRHASGLRREVQPWLARALAARDGAGALARLRRFKRREMLRIALRDLGGFAPLPQLVREISDVADVCLDSVLQISLAPLTARFGRPHHQDAADRWQPTRFAVIGLGKLGGQELNYSSDVDVIFVYDEEGTVFKEPPRKAAPPGQAMSNHEFFARLAESLVAEVARPAPEGLLYRVDLRLRPEGDRGPLVRSLAGYENYYAQWGQIWERMMLIKGRGVAGDRALAGEFLEMIQPFRYPRSLHENVRREIAAMKERIEDEVVREGELDRNVKLGRGGIREIEFVVQALQLVEGGRLPFLQTPQTLAGLEQLVRYNLLSASESTGLWEAYCFLRSVEHRLQMEQNRQTHTLPADRAGAHRVAALMGFRTHTDFDRARCRHTTCVRRVYDKLLRADTVRGDAALPRQFAGAEAEAEWRTLLAAHAFKDVDRSLRLIRQLVHGPGFGHVSSRTTELAWQLLPRLLALCPRTPPAQAPPAPAAATCPAPAAKRLSDPDRVLARLDSYLGAYGARATLFETWTHHPHLFELLILLFDRSEFLAESVIRTPDLVDELVLSDRLRRAKTAGEVLADLRYGRADTDQRQWIRRYHQAEFMRIGLRDILELADSEKVHTELSALADACLQYALDVTLNRHRRRTAPFAIIGLGKLGGREIDYGSDLDVLFVADSKSQTVSRLQPLALEVMDLLSVKTDLGAPFKVDARLRPDGEKGLLVNTLAAFELYYRRRAQLWEIQTLTRTRPIAGNAAIGNAFQSLAGQLTNFRQPSLPLAAYQPDWKTAIARMRARIETERTPRGQDDLAIKTGAGGLMDAEFIAQALCLDHGWQEANTLHALERARDSGVLPRTDADRLIPNYARLRRIEAILRRWSFEGETVLPADPAPYYRVSVRCGCDSADAFRRQVAECRHAIREVYARVFGSS